MTSLGRLHLATVRARTPPPVPNLLSRQYRRLAPSQQPQADATAPTSPATSSSARSNRAEQ